MSDPDDRTPDEVADLADRLRAKQRRGEELDFEFEIEFGSLTDAERDAFKALLNERIAHGKERLEGLTENIDILLALCALLKSSGASGLTLWEAGQAGYISVLEVVEAIRSADPLAEQEPD